MYSPELFRGKIQGREKDVLKVKNAPIANYFKSRESIDKSKQREAVSFNQRKHQGIAVNLIANRIILKINSNFLPLTFLK